MRKYKLREYFHYNKELDIEHYGYNRDDVNEMKSDIEAELWQIGFLISNNKLGLAEQKLDELREKL